MTGEEGTPGRKGLEAFEDLVRRMGLTSKLSPVTKCDLRALVDEVNVQRLSNFPRAVSKSDLKEAYRTILA